MSCCSRALPLLVFLALGLAATGVQAQVVRLETAPSDSATALIDRLLDRNDYRVIDRDTVLGEDFRHEGDLVVILASVRLEGEVYGSIAVIDGELFVRPGGLVTGPIAVLDGGAYPSAAASTGGVVEAQPGFSAQVDHAGGSYSVRIDVPPPPREISLPGLGGLGLPTYDRVNGLSLPISGRIRLGDESDGASVRGVLVYHTARGALSGGMTLEVPTSRTGRVLAGVRRRVVTNEEWIRGDLTNTLAALTFASDARDYHESDEVVLAFERRPSEPLIEGESFIGPRATLRLSRDRSLASADPWALLGGGWRPNPPIEDGTLASVTLGAAGAWRGPLSSFDGDAAVEYAPGVLGDFEFAQLTGTGLWNMSALWNHAIEVFAHTRVPIGANPAPPQRWSFLGGSGTLPTMDFGAMRGDLLVFVRTRYLAPVRNVRIPILGEPSLELVHAVGTARVSGEASGPWEQNLGAGLAFSWVRALLYVDPAADTLRPTLSAELLLPF